MAQAPFPAQPFQLFAPKGETFARHPLKKAFERLARRHLEVWKDVLLLFQMHVGAFGDLERALERLRNLAEDRRHLFVALEIELVGRKLHVRGVA